MLELIKKNIHMNCWKGGAVTQITLDDDFIVPDTMDDVDQILLDSGEIVVESIKNQGEKAAVRGKLEFRILYRKPSGGLQSMGGSIAFDEPVQVPGLEENDDIQLNWELEDLDVNAINSRKLGVRAIVTLEIKAETIKETEAAVGVNTGDTPVEVLQKNSTAASMAVRRKDTYRIKETLELPGNKPNISQILWDEMKLQSVSIRPDEGKMLLEGELSVFFIYQGEGEDVSFQCMEENIPFRGELDLSEASSDMIPFVSMHLIHREVEPKPDYDGEMRELEVDAVVELDMKLYKEEPIQLLGDMYSTREEISLQMGEVCFNRILTQNLGRCRLAEKVSMDSGERILQICHSEGSVKVDETQVKEDGLEVEGILDVKLLYLTAEDDQPVQSSRQFLPFHYVIEAPGIDQDTICRLVPGLEQLSAVMLGGGKVEIKAVISLDLLAFQPVCESVVLNAQESPLDLKKLQQMPGIVGYIVQPGDSLWKIARRFHTTVDTVKETNGLTDDLIHPGDRLILIKELA